MTLAEHKWAAPDSAEGVLTTEMNALADGANKITTAAVSNDQETELDMLADFEMYVAAQGAARDASAYIPLYILPTVDGTNYPYGGDSLDPSAQLQVGNFLFDAATNARYSVIREVLLPPGDFHVLVVNETGQALAATGNTLKMRRYNTRSVSV